MNLRILALDYDGTIAVDGVLDPRVREAILWARDQGLIVILVTGRILRQLRRVLGELELFDAIVAENGAINVFPRVGRSQRLASVCSRILLDELHARGIEADAGECIVDLDAGTAHIVLDIIHRRELPLTLHFNRGRLMVLPQAVNKATGLRQALKTMRLSTHNAVGVGDAENDHALLAACELGAAVGWGSSTLQQSADLIIEGRGPSDLAPWIRSLSPTAPLLRQEHARRSLLLGHGDDGEPLLLSVRGRNLLVLGDPRSGKSWIAGLLCEQLIMEGYCTAILDPEGDYGALEALPGVRLVGGDDPVPSMAELTRLLNHSDVSLIVDLVRLSMPDKQRYIRRAMRLLARQRRETGLPHWIVVDEAHYFLHDDDDVSALDHELAGYTLITYRASSLHPDVLAASDHVFVTRETDPVELDVLHAAWGGGHTPEAWAELLGGLQIDQVLLIPVDSDLGAPQRFRLAPRMTRHVRHRHKYLDVPIDARLAFHFRFDDGRAGPSVHTLQELVHALQASNGIEGHIQRGDLSRWLEHVFGDTALADRVRELEARHRLGTLPDFAGAICHEIERRYRATPDPI